MDLPKSENSEAVVSTPAVWNAEEGSANADSKSQKLLVAKNEIRVGAVKDSGHVAEAATTKAHTEPLRLLLKNQNILLRAAKHTEGELTGFDKPVEIVRQTLAQSPLRRVLRRKNIDQDLFIDLFLQKHRAIRAAIKEIEAKDFVTRRRKIGEIYDVENSKFFQDLAAHCEDPEELSPLDQQLTASVTSPASSGLIFQGLYVLAFAHFEHFFSSLTDSLLSQRDVLLGDLNETFTWSQIRDQESLQFTKKQLIDKTISKLLRQSMDHWIKWYTTKNKMTISDTLREECESLYSLRNSFAHELSVKTMYMQTANYELVERVCDCLATLAVSMTESTVNASQLEGAKDLYFAFLTTLEVEMLSQSRLNLVAQMCTLASNQKVPPSSIEEHRVNSWIASKRKNGIASIVNEVESWKVDQLEPVFALAKLILLDRKADARVETRRLMGQGLIRQEDIDTWPLFDELQDEEKELQ
jgi:hypothetical protein